MGVVGSIRSFLDFEISSLLSRNISKWLMYREGLIEFVETMIKALEGLI